MLKADISGLAWALGSLRALPKMATDREAVTNELTADADMRGVITGVLENAKRHFRQYGLLVAMDRIKGFEQTLTIPQYMYRNVATDCEEVVKCAESELSRVYFGYVSSLKQSELLGADTGWSVTIVAFPSARKDALMASRCYALECMMPPFITA